MGDREQELAEYRALRESARAVFQADLELLRSGLTPRALADRAGERAVDLSERAAETAQRHRVALLGGLGGVIAGGAALWLARAPVGRAVDAIKVRLGWSSEGGDDHMEKDDTP